MKTWMRLSQLWTWSPEKLDFNKWYPSEKYLKNWGCQIFIKNLNSGVKTTYLTRYLHPRYHWICALSTVLDCNLSGNIPIHVHLEIVRSLEMISNFHFCSNFDFYDFNDFCFQLYLANFNLGRPSRCVWVFYRYTSHSVQDIQDSERWTARMDFSDAPWYLMAKICSKTLYLSAKIRRNTCDAQRIWGTFLNL